jgi:hypothetical protein
LVLRIARGCEELVSNIEVISGFIQKSSEFHFPHEGIELIELDWIWLLY